MAPKVIDKSRRLWPTSACKMCTLRCAAYVGVLELFGRLQVASEPDDHSAVVLLLLGHFAKVARPFHVLDGSRQQSGHERLAQTLSQSHADSTNSRLYASNTSVSASI